MLFTHHLPDHSLSSLVSPGSIGSLIAALDARISQRRVRTLSNARSPKNCILLCCKFGIILGNSSCPVSVCSFVSLFSHSFLLSSTFLVVVKNLSVICLPNPPCTRINLGEVQNGLDASLSLLPSRTRAAVTGNYQQS